MDGIAISQHMGMLSSLHLISLICPPLLPSPSLWKGWTGKSHMKHFLVMTYHLCRSIYFPRQNFQFFPFLGASPYTVSRGSRHLPSVSHNWWEFYANGNIYGTTSSRPQAWACDGSNQCIAPPDSTCRTPASWLAWPTDTRINTACAGGKQHENNACANKKGNIYILATQQWNYDSTPLLEKSLALRAISAWVKIGLTEDAS